MSDARPPARQYPPELKQRAVEMVEALDERGAIARVAEHLDVNKETLRNWVKAAQRNRGELPGELNADDREELKALRKEVKELRRANEILKSASAFFARELDQPHKR